MKKLLLLLPFLLLVGCEENATKELTLEEARTRVHESLANLLPGIDYTITAFEEVNISLDSCLKLIYSGECYPSIQIQNWAAEHVKANYTSKNYLAVTVRNYDDRIHDEWHNLFSDKFSYLFTLRNILIEKEDVRGDREIKNPLHGSMRGIWVSNKKHLQRNA